MVVFETCHYVVLYSIMLYHHTSEHGASSLEDLGLWVGVVSSFNRGEDEGVASGLGIGPDAASNGVLEFA